MSRVVVLGGTGLLGSRTADVLTARGHDVLRASRASGVDATTGAGVAEALAGADAVVDCLDRAALRRAPAVAFFATAARTVADVAIATGVRHVVCLSIVNVTDPAVASAFGYYGGKAAQDAAYRARLGPAPCAFTSVRSTQWFEFADRLLGQFRVGPLAVVPSMRVRPVSAAAVAEALADAVEAAPSASAAASASTSAGTTIELAGPEVMDTGTMARRRAESLGGPAVATVPMPVRALRAGGLLPGPGARIDPRTFDDWLAGKH